MEPTIRKMLASDWEAVAKIYEEGIATGVATFETKVPSFEAWDKAHMNECRFVTAKNNAILGWVALSSGLQPMCIWRRCRSKCVHCKRG